MCLWEWEVNHQGTAGLLSPRLLSLLAFKIPVCAGFYFNPTYQYLWSKWPIMNNHCGILKLPHLFPMKYSVSQEHTLHSTLHTTYSTISNVLMRDNTNKATSLYIYTKWITKQTKKYIEPFTMVSNLVYVYIPGVLGPSTGGTSNIGLLVKMHEWVRRRYSG